MTQNIRLNDAIDEYIAHMIARGAKQSTIKNHQQVLRPALEAWGNIYVASITGKHIDALFASRQWGPGTRNLYLGNLKGGFFPWARRHNYMRRDFDPTDGWRNLKVGRRERRWLPMEDFPALLEACDTPRDRAIVALGLFTMCRGSELNFIKVSDLDLDHDLIDIYRQKTDEYDTMPVSQELHAEMVRWLAHYRKRMGGKLEPHWFLVPAQTGLPMKYVPELGKLQPTGEPPKYRPLKKMGKPYECVKRPLVKLGLDPEYQGVHLLRRSAGRAYFNRLRSEGYDGALKRVSAMLGHKSVLMTEHYLGIGIERQQRNELLSGKAMFPEMNMGATVHQIKEVS